VIRSAGVAAAAALALAVAGAPAADASAVSAAELRALAEQAAGDPAALARLRAVDRVDGRPVDIAGSLRGARRAALRARLLTLAAAAEPGRAPDPAAARRDARDVLGQRRFRGAELRGPFRGLLDRLGGWVDDLRDVIPTVDSRLPGGRGVVWIVLAALIAALAWALSGRSVRRRGALAAARAAAVRGAPGETPAALERRADDAERRGDHAQALRLRFRAGLLRLDARGAIELRPSLPTGEVARALRSEEFDRLAAAFDDVVYGHRPAAAEDVEAARRGWAAVLEAAR
jgi:hypothetical protein